MSTAVARKSWTSDDLHQPPQADAAERAVLGAILLDNSVIGPVRDKVRPSDFYTSAHQVIFREMLTLADAGEAVDSITLSERLTASGQLTNAGGAAYVNELTLDLVSTSNVSSHAKIVLDKSKERKIRAQLISALTEAEHGAEYARILELLPDKTALQGQARKPLDVEPTFSENLPWPSLKQEALFGLAGHAVLVLAPHTEADPVALLTTFIAEFGAMIGRAPHVELDGAYHPLLFWPVQVGASSKARKGSSDNRIRRLMQSADPDWTRGEHKGSLSSGEGLAFAVRDPQYRDEPIKHNGKPTGEMQNVCIDPGVTDKRLFLVQSEFGSVLRVMGRDGNSLSGNAREAWDGQTLSPMTKANRIRATDPHIVIVGHITRDELLKNLNETDAFNGFANRFAWFLVRRSKELPFSSNPTPTELDPIITHLRLALQAARTVNAIGMTEEAKDDWREIYSDLSRDRPGLVGSLLARSEAQVMRLAALYALLDRKRHIDDCHLRAALALWTYAEESTNQLFGRTIGDSDADRIFQEIQLKKELTDTEISALFGNHRSKSRLEQAKTLLHSMGRIHPESRQGDNGGRPRRVWVLGPGGI